MFAVIVVVVVVMNSCHTDGVVFLVDSALAIVINEMICLKDQRPLNRRKRGKYCLFHAMQKQKQKKKKKFIRTVYTLNILERTTLRVIDEYIYCVCGWMRWSNSVVVVSSKQNCIYAGTCSVQHRHSLTPNGMEIEAKHWLPNQLDIYTMWRNGTKHSCLNT